MDNLKFTTVRREQEVELTSLDGAVIKYKLREFSGIQRREYLKRFNMDITFQDGEAVVQTGKNFKPLTETEFLALCFYDESNELVKEEVILAFPSTAIIGLHKVAMELSGFDAEARKKAKND